MNDMPFTHLESAPPSPRHVAIIMDGNGRWARERGLPRAEGHRAGVEAVRRAVQAAGDLKIPYLTLFSFSSENWQRPKDEVGTLLNLMKRFIQRDLATLDENGVTVRIIGARDGLDPNILEMIERAETLTRNNSKLTLTVAFNYGAQDEIARAMRRIGEKIEAGELNAGEIDRDQVRRHLDTAGIPDPDMIIRTSGEQRLSNFLLWQSAYSELVFTPAYWPDFTIETFRSAISEYRSRDRRFGGLTAEIGR